MKVFYSLGILLTACVFLGVDARSITDKISDETARRILEAAQKVLSEKREVKEPVSAEQNAETEAQPSIEERGADLNIEPPSSFEQREELDPTSLEEREALPPSLEEREELPGSFEERELPESFEERDLPQSFEEREASLEAQQDILDKVARSTGLSRKQIQRILDIIAEKKIKQREEFDEETPQSFSPEARSVEEDFPSTEKLDTKSFEEEAMRSVEDVPPASVEDTASIEQTPERSFEDTDTSQYNPERSLENPDTFEDIPERSFEDPEVFEDNPERSFEDPEVFEDNPERGFEDPEVFEDNPERSFEDPEVFEDNPERSFEDNPENFEDVPEFQRSIEETASVEDTPSERSVEIEDPSIPDTVEDARRRGLSEDQIARIDAIMREKQGEEALARSLETPEADAPVPQSAEVEASVEVPEEARSVEPQGDAVAAESPTADELKELIKHLIKFKKTKDDIPLEEGNKHVDAEVPEEARTVENKIGPKETKSVEQFDVSSQDFSDNGETPEEAKKRLERVLDVLQDEEQKSNIRK